MEGARKHPAPLDVAGQQAQEEGGASKGGSQDSSPPTTQRTIGEASASPIFGDTAPASTSELLDLRLNNKKGGLGIVPLKHSMTELLELMESGQRKQFHDGHAWLTRFSFAKDGGLPIIDVDPAGEAAKAGVQPCDVIVAVNMKNIQDKTASKVVKDIKKCSDQFLTLTVMRPTAANFADESAAAMKEKSTKRGAASYTVNIKLQMTQSGLGFTPLKYSFADKKTASRAQKFLFRNLKERCPFAAAVGGLPVQIIEPDGLADKAGLEAWDVITFVDGVNVCHTSAADVIARIKMCPLGSELNLTVLRSVDPVVTTAMSGSPISRAIAGLHRLTSKKDTNGQMTFSERDDLGNDMIVTAAVGVEALPSRPF